tara:strand:+ start:880 stop:1128 length:249 start_codon:yes stop_codon:yes gene_type:complete
VNRDIKKIKWKCRRGLRELDLLFREYIENNLERLSLDDLKMLDSILDIEDQRLFDFIFKNISLNDEKKETFIVKNIKKFTSQ